MTYKVSDITVYDATGTAICVCGIPAGFVLVPRNPTTQMTAEGWPADEFSGNYARVLQCYRAMLSAAPTPLAFPDEQVQRTYAALIAKLLNEGAS